LGGFFAGRAAFARGGGFLSRSHDVRADWRVEWNSGTNLNLSEGCVVVTVMARHRLELNPVGVLEFILGFVSQGAPQRRPWALELNPFGVLIGRIASLTQGGAAAPFTLGFGVEPRCGSVFD
jgi:hypothetical protein